jgi:hypothetical protein
MTGFWSFTYSYMVKGRSGRNLEEPIQSVKGRNLAPNNTGPRVGPVRRLCPAAPKTS